MEVEIPLKKRKHQKKGTLKQNVETSLYTLYWGFEKIPFTLYTYVLDKILQNGYTKTDSQFQKSREEFVILCNVTKKKRVEKNVQIRAIGMMTSLFMSIFLKTYAKNG